jgi:UPF0716 protein FxsA
MPPPQKSSLFGRLLLLFTIVPIAELALLIWLGQQIGFWPTVALIAGTALLGSFLAHREGLSALARFRSRLAAGEMPGDALTDGIIILIAGAFLLTPGVLTDVVGFLGLLPPSRALIKRAVMKRVKRGMLGGSIRVATWPPSPSPPPQDDVVDVEYEEVDSKA